MLRARVTILVHTVPKSHYLLFIGKLALNIRLCLVERADFIQHFHNRFVSSTMKRPLQRANGGSNAGINIRQRCDSHASGERRCVELVICMKYKRLIQSTNSYWVRLISGQHVEKIMR
ncbi:hypothetical protein D3C78_1194320 [compost metagenome]